MRFAWSCVMVFALAGCAANPFSNARMWKLQTCAETSNTFVRFTKADNTTLAIVPREACARMSAALGKIGREANYRIEELYVTDAVGINAFATRDNAGRAVIVVTIAMLSALGTDEDAWAGLLGHETAHLVSRHSDNRESAKNMAETGGQVVANILSQVIPGMGGVVAGTVGGTLAQTMMYGAYTRPQEAEADQLGLRWMVAAGYDPRGLLRLFEVLGKQSSLPAFLSTHPGAGDRAQAIREFIARMPTTGDRGAAAAANSVSPYGSWKGSSRSNVSGSAVQAEMQINSAGTVTYKTIYGAELTGTFQQNGNAIVGLGTMRIPESYRGQRLPPFSDGTRETTITFNGAFVSDTKMNGTFAGGGDSGIIEFTRQ